jgi:hypothetical protein
VKALILPKTPTLSEILKNSIKPPTKNQNPSFGPNRSQSPSFIGDSVLMTHNHVFNRKEMKEIQFKFAVDSSDSDERADIESVGSDADAMDRSFVEM